MKKLFSLLLIALSIPAWATTFTPIQLLNPAGSVAGQAIVSTGPSTVPAWGGIGLNGINAIAANTVVANATGSSASPTAFAVPSCSTSASALQWTSGTGFTCNSAINAATLGGATFASPGSIGGTTAAAGKFTTLQATAAITPSSTSGIVGTTTNDSANAGSIGEYAANTSSGTSLTNNVTANATSISLTAGDWDVQGIVNFVPAGSTVVTGIEVGVSTTSATLGALGSYSLMSGTLGTGVQQAIATPVTRISLSSTTTVFVVSIASFSASTMTVNGAIRARRVR